MEKPKPRVIKDFDKIDPEVREQIKLAYPYGFAKYLVYFNNKDGMRVSALPFETDEKYYLVRMTQNEAREIIRDDDDYADGQLRVSVKEEYEDKYSELDHMSDYISTEEEEDIENIPDDSVDIEDI